MPLSATVPANAPPSEKRFAAALQHRFFLRVHMMAMLTGTLLVGILTTRLLFAMHVRLLGVRYAIAVIAAYAAFVGLVKLWLAYVGFCAARSNSDWSDCLNFSGGGGGSSGSSVSFSGGGGKFGGGGASGSWDDGSDAGSRAVVAATPMSQSSSSSKSSSSSSGKSSSGGGGGSDDLGELMLVVLIIAVAVAILASFAWMVWAAPGILSETAFNAALAGALTRHAHQATHGDWIGSVVRKTAIPFVLILTLCVTTGWWAQRYCPQAQRLTDALHCVR